MEDTLSRSSQHTSLGKVEWLNHFLMVQTWFTHSHLKMKLLVSFTSRNVKTRGEKGIVICHAIFTNIFKLTFRVYISLHLHNECLFSAYLPDWCCESFSVLSDRWTVFYYCFILHYLLLRLNTFVGHSSFLGELSVHVLCSPLLVFFFSFSYQLTNVSYISYQSFSYVLEIVS